MKRGNSHNNEQGMAAIFIVLILMTLLALISIGFSRLMNREVRQSLDRQLSTAAYYAAESGVNDSRAYLTDPAATKIDGCATPASAAAYFVKNGDISGDGLFKYSCVIVNPTPKELQFDIAAGQTKVVKLSGPSLSALSRLYFSWQNSAGYSGSPQPIGTYPNLPQQTTLSTDSTGLLRVGIYPLVNGCSGIDSIHGGRQAWYANALGSNTADAAIECAGRSYFMYPGASSGPAPNCGYASLKNSNGCVRYIENNNLTINNDGGLVPGNCQDPPQKPNTSFSAQATSVYCNALVSNLWPVAGSAGTNSPASYYLRLTAVYKSIKVFIQATDNSSPTPKTLTISNAEAIIDVTGTGNDILRRIQAKAPLQDNVPQLNYGLQSMESVCKLFRVPVAGPGVYDPAQPDSTFDTYNKDNACAIPSGSNNIDNSGLPPVVLPPPIVAYATLNTCNNASVPCDSPNSGQTVTVNSGSGKVNNPFGTVFLTNLQYFNGNFAVTLWDDAGHCENFTHTTPSMGDGINPPAIGGPAYKVYRNAIVAVAGDGPYSDCSNQR